MSDFPSLGDFELLVLLALLHLGDEAYGVSVQREIATRTERDASFAAVYTTLSRLENKGLVESVQGEPTPERGGRGKKFFALTALGRRTLKKNLATIRAMTRGLDPAWNV